MSLRLSQLFFFASILAFTGAQAETKLNTDQFSQYEDDQPVIREQFVREQNKSTHARLAKSPNYRPIEKWLKGVYEPAQVRKEVELDKKNTLKLVDRGLGKPTDLVLVKKGYEEVLFSGNHFKRNNTATFVDFQVSPDRKRVAMAFALSGSIDQSQIAILNLARRELEAPVITVTSTDFSWYSSKELLVRQTQSDGNEQSVKFDVELRKAVLVLLGGGMLDHTAGAVLWSDGRGKTKVRNLDLALGWQEVVVSPKCKNIIGADKKFVYLVCLGKDQLGELRAVAVDGKSTDKYGKLLAAEAGQPVRKTFFAGTSAILMLRQGAARKLRLYGVSATASATAELPLQAEIPVPDCCSVVNVRWEVPGQKLRFTLVSAVQNETSFVYDLASSSWDKDVTATMMTAEGVKYQTQILDVVSHDGSHVPLRVTMRADAKADGSHPAFFFTYGGFKRPGYLDPVYKAPFVEFMRRGGIYATPGIRGGDEFGPEWHDQATREKKINTFYDLSASAKFLIDQGWTTAPKVISAGGSNGGLTVAATGLLFPENFGLVVPYAGVLDMLGKDHLDPRNEGWSWEYGSANEEAMKEPLKAISPLELVSRQGSVRYLVFTGLSDSRVNTAHSLKFVAAMKEQGTDPSKVDLVALENSGHWMSKESYQNLIGWYCDVVLWTTVFDQVGWTW